MVVSKQRIGLDALNQPIHSITLAPPRTDACRHSEDSAPAAERLSARSKSGANPWWLLGTIALVAWACLRFPKDTMTARLDPSWSGVLVYAHEHDLQFGRDIVWTYGPLGFLSVSCFFPQIALARIFFELALGCGIATALCLVAWRMAVPWRVGMLGFFVLVSMPLHWGGDALLVDLGIFAWGLLCFLESGRRLTLFTLPLVALVVTGALIKFTFLVIGSFTIGLLACDLALRGRRALAFGVVTGSLLAFMLGWLLLKQSLSGLGAFLSTSYGMAGGYNAAMGREYGDVALILIMMAATLAAAAIRSLSIPAGTGFPVLRRALLFVWIAGLVFVNWKHVCVRADSYHVELLFGFMPLVAVSMEALPVARRQAALWSTAASLLCLYVASIIIRCQIDEGSFPLSLVKAAWQNMSESLGIISQPGRYLREKTEAFCAEQKADQLPQIRASVGRATADVFGYSQSYALFNELNYRPRPIFQSYTVYTRPMMELNEQFYLTKDSPEYVLFHLAAIDARFPAIEDAFVLRDLLVNYESALGEGDFLLLRRLGTEKAQLTLVREGTVHAGEMIDLQNQPNANVWLEIDVRPSALSRLRQFLYKPQKVLLALRARSSTAPVREFLAPAAMLSAGFLASPMVLDNDDVMKLYTGGEVSRPDGYSVELPPSLVNAWQPEIHFRIYRIENKLGRASL
jgi:hypothetical protein